MIFKTIHTAASLIALAQYLGAQVASLVYLNGSTDYLELYTYAEGTTLRLEGSTAGDNYFQACLVRPA